MLLNRGPFALLGFIRRASGEIWKKGGIRGELYTKGGKL